MGDETQLTGGPSQPSVPVGNAQDLLADIFGTGPTEPTKPAAPQRAAVDDILSLFGNSTQTATAPTTAASSLAGMGDSLFSQAPPPAAAAPPPKQELPGYTAYDKNELKVTLTPQVSPARPGVVNIMARFQVSGSTPASNVHFQAAVPKTQQLQMLPMSSQIVAPGSIETQQIRVIAPAGVSRRSSSITQCSILIVSLTEPDTTSDSCFLFAGRADNTRSSRLFWVSRGVDWGWSLIESTCSNSIHTSCTNKEMTHSESSNFRSSGGALT